MIELVLPWPPSVNSYKRVGRTVTTKSGKKYQQRVNTSATQQFYNYVWMKIRSEIALKQIAVALPLTIDIGVVLWVHPPDNRRRDIDNLLKVTLDSLMYSRLIKDDSQIHRLLVEKKSIVPNGKIILRIEKLSCNE